MKTLTNDYTAVRVWNLEGPQGQRGPYLVTQLGIAPNDELMRESLFLLRPDGCWVDVTAYMSAGQPEFAEEAFFDSTEQIMTLLDQLGAEVKVADLPVSEEGLRAWLANNPPGTALARAQLWVEQYLERRRQRGAPEV